MKIQGPGQTQQTSKSKKKGKTEGTEGSFGEFIASGTKQSSGAATTQSIAKVDALLAVQAAEDPTERASRGRMRARADNVLSELDKVRMAMLNDNLTMGHMVDIADVVAEHRERIQDPALSAIMDEIDLRAQVELAKMRVILDKAEAQKS